MSGVGKLTLMTPAGLEIDLREAERPAASGELAGLIELRDKSLVRGAGPARRDRLLAAPRRCPPT